MYTPPLTQHTCSDFTATIEALRPSDGDRSPEFAFLRRDRVYYAGEFGLLEQPGIAIIGSRRASRQGVLRARRLARLLVEHGIVVVSGLAEGIDAAAHRSALEHGGRTVAVIGTPLDRAFPAKNTALQERVWQEHLLVSPFPSGHRTGKADFPHRNQIMAFVSDASVVIEASERSGTLHQARACQKLGRPLFFARSLLDSGVTWPCRFLDEYPNARILESISDITSIYA